MYLFFYFEIALPHSLFHFQCFPFQFPTLSSGVQIPCSSGSSSFFERNAVSPCSVGSNSFSNLPQSPILMNSPFSNAISDIERLQLEREVNEAKQKLKTIQEERDMAVYQRDQVRSAASFLFCITHLHVSSIFHRLSPS